MHRHLVSLAAAAATVTVATAVVACAHADPGTASPSPTGPPQPGASCPANLDGALTALPARAGDPPNKKNLLECTDDEWQSFTGEYPSSDRWLSTGPELALHGQGVRNPEILAGTWTATPQTADTQCHLETVGQTHAGVTGESESVTAEPGQTLTYAVSDHLFTIKLSGFCLWERES